MAVPLPSLAAGEDKSGVSPKTISLPSGPGSIEGLGDSFQPMLNTGTARYAVTIKVPPGTAGHAPQLRLQYDSGYGFGPSGIGWRYGPGAISRQTDKRLPRYVDDNNGLDDDFDFVVDEADEIDIFLGPDGEELVEVEENIFRARIEESFIRYRHVGDHWEADLGNGTTLTFGESADARVTDGDGTRIFRWLLEKSTDVNGNTIEYSYTSFPGSENQKYLQEIRYGPGASPWPVFYFISFNYQIRPDWRIDYRSGFALRTDQRLIGINVGIQGTSPEMCAIGDWNDDSTADSLINRYELSYSLGEPNISQLSRVTRYGSDGVNYLPPISFDYISTDLPQVISAEDQIITADNAPVTVMDSDLVDLVDLNRDGLPDILHTDRVGASHTCYLNLGVNEEAITKEITWASGQLMSNTDGQALNLQLAEDRVSVADMDGDGISDLVHTTDSGSVYYYRNTGNLSWDNRQAMSIQDFAPPAPFLLKDVTTVDLDFDKRIDVVQSTESGYSIWFNLEEGKYSRKVHASGARHGSQILRFAAGNTQIADMNGDRLADVVRVSPSEIIFAASLGHGNFAPSISIPIPGTTLQDGENSQLSRAKIVDVNSDGLADLVVERAEANLLWYWLNRGTNSFSEKHTISYMPTQFGPSTAVRWADMNGNSTVDLVYADSSASERIRVLDIGELLTGSGPGNLLTGIKNGLGVTTAITYRSSTRHYLRDWAQGVPWQMTVPFPVQVVSKVQVTTGLDLDEVNGPDRYVKEYRYRDGYYADRENQFRGFGEVQVIEWGDDSAPTRITTNGFFTGGPDGLDNDGDTDIDELSSENHREEDSLKGRISFVERSSATGNVINREENSWLIKNLLIGLSGTEVRFSYNIEKTKLIYEGAISPESIITTFAYDDYGNVIEKKQFGALSISGDERFTYNTYINETADWILGKEQRGYLTGADDITIAETRNYYDNPDYVGLEGGSLTKGLLTRKESWVGGSTWVNLMRNGYDSYGNVVGSMNSNGFLRTVSYDADLHIYPELETIQVGGGSSDLSLAAAYNIGIGTVVSSADFNGNEHRFGHDIFGRPTSITRPGDSAGLPTQLFAYEMTDPEEELLYSYDSSGSLTLTAAAPRPSSITTREREISGQGATFDRVEYIDGMGRRLCEVEDGEEGFIVKDAISFNSRGTIHRRYPPYQSDSQIFSRPPSEPFVEFFYDIADREVLVNNLPDADEVITNVSTGYLPLKKEVADENGHVTTYLNDGLEQLIRIEEDNGGEILATQYDYDPLGNLTIITDAQNNVRSMEYDGLGRRTLLLDPDRGEMEYTYDPDGNLIQTIDNKGQILDYTYDGTDRILTEDYLDVMGITPDITYHYDAPSTDYVSAANLGGRRAWVEDLSGATFFSYDERGNPTWIVKRINDDSAVTDYQSQVSYDAMNRPVTLTYPDGSSIQYLYNDRSLLESISGIVEQIEYHPSGKRSGITYANGLTSTYSYDPRQRLTQLRTDFTAPTSNPTQDLSYQFDGASNVLSITDNRLLPSGGVEDASQLFVYDDLDRLVRAQGPGYGRIDYGFDKIGNMTLKLSPDGPDPLHIDDPLINLGIMASGGASGTNGRGVKLPGTDPGPHAITSTGSGLVFNYDDNGNMVAADGDNYGWDFRDRMAASSANGTMTAYFYDYSGRRIIKKSAGSVNYYISKAYEIRNNGVRKYVFDGNLRVARIEEASQVGEVSTQVVNFYPGFNFFSISVEPANPAITSLLASLNGNYSEVWTYDQASGQYLGYVPSESRFDFSEIHAQQSYIIHMDSTAVLTVSGIKTADPINLAIGWNLVPSFVGTPTPPAEALTAVSDSYNQVWTFQGASGAWQSHLPVQPPFLNNLDAIRPASAYWIEMNAAGQLTPEQELNRVFFYHPDHLGSSAVVTDMAGAVVERSEFYPFGLLRHQQHNGFDSSYKFTSKERDKESGLDYFEARYYHPVASSFISVDPYEGDIMDQQGFNRYGYVRNNPIRSIDPNGLSWVDAISTGLGVMDQVVETDSEKAGEEEGEEGQSTLVQGLTRIGFHSLSMAIAGDFSNSDKLFELGLIGASFALEVAQEETGWDELETIAGAGLGAAQMIKGITEGDVGETIRSGLSTAESTASLFGGERYVQGAYLTVGNFMDAMNSVYGGTTDMIGIEKEWVQPEQDKGKQAKSYWREKTGKDEAYQKLAPHMYDAYDFFGM